MQSQRWNEAYFANIGLFAITDSLFITSEFEAEVLDAPTGGFNQNESCIPNAKKIDIMKQNEFSLDVPFPQETVFLIALA
jgi:hypothetical protein